MSKAAENSEQKNISWFTGQPRKSALQDPTPSALGLEVQVRIKFYSYYKDLAGCSVTGQVVHAGSNLGKLLSELKVRFPRLAAENSALLAVGLDYQPRTYVLQQGDEVSIFPPVQGG
ncbi:MAG: hypothetical protein C5B50_17820 [Verrucomicrobia bacterium]|nr:MAG: hypothetical protein C5B50_17820 [Verrucomicrobiota bacterium]